MTFSPGRYWDALAREDALRAIYDNDAIRAAADRQAHFDAAGVDEARYLAWFVHPDAHVVDLGCGIGRLARPLAPLCRTLTGVDVSAEMLARAKAYLAGVDNVRLLQTDGRSLAGIDAGTVDFLYSALVLIHVDRRSAFHYMNEIRRVLAAQGLAWLQFHDIESDAGLAKFVEKSTFDDPLEFYTEAELRRLLGAAGLDVVAVERGVGFLELVVCRGNAGEWLAATAAQITIASSAATGAFAGGSVDLASPAELRLSVHCAGEAPRTVALLAAIVRDGRGPDESGWMRFDGVVPLRRGATTDISLRYRPEADANADAAAISLVIDGAVAAVQRGRVDRTLPPGEGTLHLALLPSGCWWRPQFLTRFAHLAQSSPVVVRS